MMTLSRLLLEDLRAGKILSLLFVLLSDLGMNLPDLLSKIHRGKVPWWT